jgi:hypothetical protein
MGVVFLHGNTDSSTEIDYRAFYFYRLMPYMPHLRCSTGLDPSREGPYLPELYPLFALYTTSAMEF